jgi:ferredoxin-nitrite reductase
MAVEANPSVKLNKIEKVKAEKEGLAVKAELDRLIEQGWENIDKSDLELRLKWLGVFFRPVTPGQFMLRLRIPHGCLNVEQLTALAEIIQQYGDEGTADITTRQNLQLRGIRFEDIPSIFKTLQRIGLTSVQSGMDNVRNLTGSPVAGIDPDELIDTREMMQKLQDAITGNGEGNPRFANLPRKLNIAIEGARDNSIHAEINDIALLPAYTDDVLGFNVVVGGYISAQRAAMSVPMGVWVPAEDQAVVDLCCAILSVYSDHGLAEGLRENRAKARLMWLVEGWGVEKFRAEVEKELGYELADAAPKDEVTQDKKDHLGVHPQKQAGFNYIGLHIPAGRLDADLMFELARLADVYGNGEIRLTVEQNAIIPFVPDDRIEAFLSEPLLETCSVSPATLSRSLVSCTGKAYCNFAMIDTKAQAIAVAAQLDAELNIPQRVRLHWTGCPNSCGQAQAGDIGMMGAKVRKDGKMVEGVKIFTGGQVGHNSKLGELTNAGVACEDLPDVLRQMLIDDFGATLKPVA